MGLEFGFDKHLTKPTQVINAVNKIYREVKENPKAFYISQEVLELVEKGILDRRTKKNELLNPPMDPGKINEKDLIVGVKNKAWTLLDQKLNYLFKNKKAFRNESVISLAKIAGIAFDKSQIMKGEATEHIALRAKIDDNISSQDAVTQLLKFRESLVQEE